MDPNIIKHFNIALAVAQMNRSAFASQHKISSSMLANVLAGRRKSARLERAILAFIHKNIKPKFLETIG
jgi:hypothetical protein